MWAVFLPGQMFIVLFGPVPNPESLTTNWLLLIIRLKWLQTQKYIISKRYQKHTKSEQFQAKEKKWAAIGFQVPNSRALSEAFDGTIWKLLLCRAGCNRTPGGPWRRSWTESFYDIWVKTHELWMKVNQILFLGWPWFFRLRYDSITSCMLPAWLNWYWLCVFSRPFQAHISQKEEHSNPVFSYHAFFYKNIFFFLMNFDT